MSNYRKEATVRVTTMSIIAVIAALGAWIISYISPKFVPSTASDSFRHNFTIYVFFIGFGLICSPLVFVADKKLNKRFNKNP